MSLLKNILRPFVEFNKGEDEEPSLQEDKVQQKSEPGDKGNIIDNAGIANTANRTTSTVSTQVPSDAKGVSKSSTLNDYHQYFENLVEEANAKNPIFQGTNFKEFIDSKVDVEAIADEGRRYKTAFNVLKRTGLTKERLVTTGQQYIQLIDQDL